MPLLLLLLGLFVPRITVLVLLFMSNWFQGMFNTMLWPFLGFLFLPLSLLWYSAVHHWFGGEWTAIPIIGMVVAVLLDISPVRPRRRKIAQA